MKKYIGLSCIPERFDSLILMLENIIPQADKLFIHVDGSLDYPDVLKNDKIFVTCSEKKNGSQMKFEAVDWLLSDKEDCFFLTIDDDVKYQDDYIETMVNNMIQVNNSAVVCVHGINYINLDNIGFYNNIQAFTIQYPLRNRLRVMQAGTGTTCMYLPFFSFSIKDAPHKNMEDLWVAIKAAKNNVPIYAIPRSGNEIVPLNDGGVSIWGNDPIDKIIPTLKEHIGLFKSIPIGTPC